MFKSTSLKLAAALALVSSAITAQAQDAGALVDRLVKKGVLTAQEGEEVRADMTRDFAATPAGKINISNSITELKLYGDLRLRYQYDNKDGQLDPLPVGVHSDRNEKDRSPNSNQRSRWRFRLRLNAEARLTENFAAGVELQTSQNSDSANQTFENGFNDYGIFISRAYVSWMPTDWLTVVGGKFANPFYTTDLVWDADINPNGLTESVALHKLFAGASEAGFSKDGKGYAPPIKEVYPWELTLVAGQFVFDDNLEGGGRDNATRDNDQTTDAYLFETQLISSYKFGNGIKLTVAPAWFTYVNGSVTGAENENSFNDSATVSGATRNLNLILVPGDVAFKAGDLKTRFYWDFAYNIEGRKRVDEIYNVKTLRSAGIDPDDFDRRHNNLDNVAYLVGVQVGENKKKGDWSALLNWRRTGIGSVDPNLNDSDFALGELNTQGIKAGVAYNFTDFCVFGVTYMHAWNLRGDLTGGEATGGNAIADANAVQVLQVDLNVKF
ncbi:MAG: hypothetical protein JWL90_1157 [Chthoniobacteraceae bacterium]|nr:hypothetical protein [Chthoniobacteraceae bacterium]